MVGEMRGYQQHFTAEALKPLLNATLERSSFPEMIFIVGMMRSGSTLAESMLDRSAHSAVLINGRWLTFLVRRGSALRPVNTLAVCRSLETSSDAPGIQRSMPSGS